MPGQLKVDKHYTSITVNTETGGVQLENSPAEIDTNFLLWVVEERIFEASVYNSFLSDTNHQNDIERRIRNYDFVDQNSGALGGANPFNGGVESHGQFFVGRSNNDPWGRAFSRAHFNPQNGEMSINYSPAVGLPRAMEYEYAIARLVPADNQLGWREHDRVRIFNSNIVDFVSTITVSSQPGTSNNRIRRA